MLGGESSTVRVDRFGHWACGWWESLSVAENSQAHLIAENMKAKMEGYPVLDEEDWCELESEEAARLWGAFTIRERIAWLRENYASLYHRSLSDLLGCARGDYFLGNPSDLLG